MHTWTPGSSRKLMASVSTRLIRCINILPDHLGYQCPAVTDLSSPGRWTPTVLPVELGCHLLGGIKWVVLMSLFFKRWTPFSIYKHPHDFTAQAAQTVIHKQIQCLVAQKTNSSSRQPNSSISLLTSGKMNRVEETKSFGSVVLFVSVVLISADWG